MQPPRTPIFVFVAQKGGVGKTVIATNFAAALARETPTRPLRNILVVDTDVQGNSERALGAEPAGEGTPVLTLADMLLAVRDGRTAEIPDYPYAETITPGVTLAAGGDALDEIDDELGAAGREAVKGWMKEALAAVAGEYDAVVVDTGARVDALTMGAILSADLLLCVAKPEDSFVTDALTKVDRYLTDLGDLAPPMVTIANEAAPSRRQYRLVNEVITTEMFPSLERGAEILERRTGKRTPWIAEIPVNVTIRDGARDSLPLVISRRSSSEAGRKLRALAEEAHEIALERQEVAR